MNTSICILSLMATALSAAAQGTEAMLNYAATAPLNGSPVFSTIYSEINGPVGWTFQPAGNIDVTALGAFAYLVPRNGLDVGLWDSSGNLLASELVTTTGTAVDQSFYESITPVLLDADQTYYVAAYSPSGPMSAIVVTPTVAPNGYATMSPDIQLGEVAYSEGSGFSFPSTIDGEPDFAIIAPNFEFQPVPEPSTLCLLGGSMVGLLVRRRLRK